MTGSMKKIVFCLQTMVLGGVEKELIAVLKKIHGDFDITLLLLHLEDTEIIKEIPDGVKIQVVGIDKTYYLGSTAALIRQRVKRGRFAEAASVALKRSLRIGMSASNLNFDEIPPLAGSYDVAICYHIHSPLALRYVAEKIRAQKKIGWIHNDFYVTGYPIHRLKKYVTAYDEFVAVSKKVEREFRSLCPWYRGGISTAYNYLDADEIRARSKCAIEDRVFLQEQSTKILTIGRFVEQKGIDQAILVCAKLKERHLNFHWFLIGYGPLEHTYRELIEQYDVADRFTILGKKENPYPYINSCEIYVQPSRHEAFPLVPMEAKILRTPVICTNYDGADEQVNNGVDGMIVPLNDVPALCEAISCLIASPETRERFSRELEKWSADDDLQRIIHHFV